jgi:hypothetical protein
MKLPCRAGTGSRPDFADICNSHGFSGGREPVILHFFTEGLKSLIQPAVDLHLETDKHGFISSENIKGQDTIKTGPTFIPTLLTPSGVTARTTGRPRICWQPERLLKDLGAWVVADSVGGAVPEPGSIALVGLGLAGAALLRRRCIASR